jgi:2-phosphosulfolactate phosphatase
MEIVRTRLASGARNAMGVAVIIDVFRAFSCEPLFFCLGAEGVILEADPDHAILMKQQIPRAILVGEVNEVPIDGADLGNSPSEIALRGEAFFKGRTVVHRTTAGVTGATAALETADEVILGSFLMAGAIASYMRKKEPHLVTLVAMGSRGERESPEDEACADYLEHLMAGRPYDHIESLKTILYHPSAQKFFKGDKPYLPKEDPVFCLQRDLFDFVLKVKRGGDGLNRVSREDCGTNPVYIL